MNINEAAITVALREDGENVLVLGAFDNYELAVEAVTADIGRMIDAIEDVPVAERMAEAARLVDELLIVCEVIPDVEWCPFSWQLQIVALNQPVQ